MIGDAVSFYINVHYKVSPEKLKVLKSNHYHFCSVP